MDYTGIWNTMPIQGLPQVLEKLLESVLLSHDISTWNIFGENQGGLTFRIKFCSTEISSGIDQIGVPHTIAYRRKCQGQVRRDRSRALRRRNENSDSNDSIQQDHSEIVNDEVIVHSGCENHRVEHDGQIIENKEVCEKPMDTSCEAANVETCIVENKRKDYAPVIRNRIRFTTVSTDDSDHLDSCCSETTSEGSYAGVVLTPDVCAKLKELREYLAKENGVQDSDLDEFYRSKLTDQNYKPPES